MRHRCRSARVRLPGGGTRSAAGARLSWSRSGLRARSSPRPSRARFARPSRRRWHRRLAPGAARGRSRLAGTKAPPALPRAGHACVRYGRGGRAAGGDLPADPGRDQRAARALAAKTPVTGHSMHVRGIGEEPTRRRMRHAAAGPARPDWINADLHVHSNFSKDCASRWRPSWRLLGRSASALSPSPTTTRSTAPSWLKSSSGGDPFVIVAEEVKTAEGEVIGLFLKKRIPGGLSFDETLSLIKEQGGLVYVPHPFDGLRTTPSYRALVDNLHRIDVIEIYNAQSGALVVQPEGRALRGQVQYRGRRGQRRARVAGSRHRHASACRASTIRRASWPPYGRPTSSPDEESALSAVAEAAADHSRPGLARGLAARGPRRARIRRNSPTTRQYSVYPLRGVWSERHGSRSTARS